MRLRSVVRTETLRNQHYVITLESLVLSCDFSEGEYLKQGVNTREKILSQKLF